MYDVCMMYDGLTLDVEATFYIDGKDLIWEKVLYLSTNYLFTN